MTSSDYIALFALIVSLCAVTLTVYEAIQNRKHQRLSVKPKLDIDIHLFKEKGELRFDLTNKGLGPAFILKYSVLVDNKKINSTPRDLWKNILKNLGVSDWKYEMYIPNSQSVLSPNVTYCLWKLFVDPLNDNIEEYLTRVKINIEYKSIYGESDILMIDGQEISESKV